VAAPVSGGSRTRKILTVFDAGERWCYTTAAHKHQSTDQNLYTQLLGQRAHALIANDGFLFEAEKHCGDALNSALESGIVP